MNTLKKRIMCFLLCTALIVAGSGLSIPVSVYADTSSEVTIVDSGMCGDNVTWTYYSDGTMNLTGTGPTWSCMGERPIDAYRTERPFEEYCSSIKVLNIGPGITEIGHFLFYDCQEIREVNFSEGLTFIGRSAFCCCTMLTSLTFPDSLETVYAYAFQTCLRVKKIHLGSGVKNIYPGAFLGCCKLENITFNEGLEEIWELGFSGYVQMTEIDLPFSLKKVCINSFYHWEKIESIWLPCDTKILGGDQLIREDDSIIATKRKHNCNATYKWNGYDSCVVNLNCKVSGCGYSASEVCTVENGKITSEVTKVPTCNSTGERTYTATVLNGQNEYSTTKTQVIAKDSSNHAGGTIVRIENKIEATYDSEGTYDEVTYCAGCNAELSREAKTIPKLVRSNEENDSDSNFNNTNEENDSESNSNNTNEPNGASESNPNNANEPSGTTESNSNNTNEPNGVANSNSSNAKTSAQIYKISVANANLMSAVKGTSKTLNKTARYKVGNFYYIGKVNDGVVSFAGVAKNNIKTVTIPATVKIYGKKCKVTSISKCTFEKCKNLTKVVIGTNIIVIGAKAFNGCKKLGSVTFKGKQLKTIGKSAFKNTKKKLTITVPKGTASKYKKLLKGKGLVAPKYKNAKK